MTSRSENSRLIQELAIELVHQYGASGGLTFLSERTSHRAIIDVGGYYSIILTAGGEGVTWSVAVVKEVAHVVTSVDEQKWRETAKRKIEAALLAITMRRHNIQFRG